LSTLRQFFRPMFHIELRNWLDYSKNVFFSDSKPLAKFIPFLYVEMLRSYLIACSALAFIAFSHAQTPGSGRLFGHYKHKRLQSTTWAQPVQPVSLGPSVFSCRVTDLEVNPDDPTEMYIAYASGGLWHTRNNGTSFEPIFDHEASMTIGDIAVDWKRRVIWVGTGEANSSRSSYAGTGMYVSSDNGKTWQHRGLVESHHIGRVVLHPTDPNTLWVAALGHLYSSNADRGVYRTTDGGTTWQKTLYVDENSGAIDLCLDPTNPNTVYAATWYRTRRAWEFVGAGEGSGIWKSVDGGATFQRLTTPRSGFPSGPNTGRIGLAIGQKDGKTILYASLDNQNPKPESTDAKSEPELTAKQFRGMSVDAFAALDDKQLETYLKNNDFPEKYTPAAVKKMVQKGQIKPEALADYIEDANANLFNTNYIGAEVYKSDDGGATWTKTHSDPIEQMFFTYGYYFSNIRCAPNDASKVYLLGYHIIRSSDGGATWENISGDNVHPDHHALWVNPSRPDHLVNGNDGGVNISWDNGASWILCNQPPVGQFYYVTADHADPYNVYGGAQDNGVWVGPSTYTASTEWHQNGQYPYRSLLGGDGMQVQVDPRDNITVYTGYQFGNYFRINRLNGNTTAITPKHELGERPLRWNWQTPILLSPHQSDVLYMGANKLYRSFNRGNTWEAISGDLTQGGKPGNVPYGTLTCISESPLKFGLIYTGSDDGLIHLTRDGGDTWTRLNATLPADLWVSEVVASAHVKSRVYVVLNGYRYDNFNAMVYVSDDYGQTWAEIADNLPTEPANALVEDPDNPNLLYLGTDGGVYFTLDRGRFWQALGDDFPSVPVHDLAFQRKAKDLLVGTHGRSMYRANVGHLQQLTPEVLEQPLYVFDLTKKRFARGWGKKQPYKPAKDPEYVINLYARQPGAIKWRVTTQKGLTLQMGDTTVIPGLNRLTYHLDIRPDALNGYKKELELKDAPKPSDTGKVYLQPGKYKLIIELNGARTEQELIVE
jgi:photosystem II stability/assembly factor-like uncharacterized protein